MNNGYSILELLIAISLLGIALEIGASALNFYIQTQSNLENDLYQIQMNGQAWENSISNKPH